MHSAQNSQIHRSVSLTYILKKCLLRCAQVKVDVKEEEVSPVFHAESDSETSESDSETSDKPLLRPVKTKKEESQCINTKGAYQLYHLPVMSPV